MSVYIALYLFMCLNLVNATDAKQVEVEYVVGRRRRGEGGDREGKGKIGRGRGRGRWNTKGR